MMADSDLSAAEGNEDEPESEEEEKLPIKRGRPAGKNAKVSPPCVHVSIAHLTCDMPPRSLQPR